MRPSENIEKLIKSINIETNAKTDKSVLADVVEEFERSRKDQSAFTQPSIWRIIMKSQITKLAAAAVIFIAIMLVINYPGTSIDGASTVFAAAINHVQEARTFSCIPIFEVTYEDGGKEGKYLLKQQCMFIEPDLERNVTLTSPWPRYIGEVKIKDYGTRQRLVINPVERTAVLSDMSFEYTIDPDTGKLIQTQLDTRLRDRLLELTAGAVADLGSVELDGRSVRMLQSIHDDRVTTVWVDPETNFPVQIEHTWPDQNRPPVTYTKIQIDTELDEALFSLEPPDGYAFSIQQPDWSDYQMKLSAKMRYLLLNCVMYASEKNGEYPKELTELNEVGITDQILKNILTSEDQPDGPVVIQYRPPRGDTDLSTEVVLYEIYEKWPKDGVVAGFADGHTEIISDQNLFEELIK